MKIPPFKVLLMILVSIMMIRTGSAATTIIMRFEDDGTWHGFWGSPSAQSEVIGLFQEKGFTVSTGAYIGCAVFGGGMSWHGLQPIREPYAGWVIHPNNCAELVIGQDNGERFTAKSIDLGEYNKFLAGWPTQLTLTGYRGMEVAGRVEFTLDGVAVTAEDRPVPFERLTFSDDFRDIDRLAITGLNLTYLQHTGYSIDRVVLEIPEPSAMLGCGLSAVFLPRRRRRHE